MVRGSPVVLRRVASWWTINCLSEVYCRSNSNMCDILSVLSKVYMVF